MTRKLPLVPTLLVAAAVSAMVALGVWQLGRAEWKAGLIARYAAAQALSASVPWPRSEAELERAAFRWSQFTCERVLAFRIAVSLQTSKIRSAIDCAPARQFGKSFAEPLGGSICGALWSGLRYGPLGTCITTRMRRSPDGDCATKSVSPHRIAHLPD